MAKKLTCTFYLNGEPVDKIPDEALDIMCKRMGEAASEYYTRHPDEWARLQEVL